MATTNLRAHPRPAASIAAPVLVLVGIPGSMLASVATDERTTDNELRAQTAAQLVVVSTALVRDWSTAMRI